MFLYFFAALLVWALYDHVCRWRNKRRFLKSLPLREEELIEQLKNPLPSTDRPFDQERD